jgi:hypothetical protein
MHSAHVYILTASIAAATFKDPTVYHVSEVLSTGM